MLRLCTWRFTTDEEHCALDIQNLIDERTNQTTRVCKLSFGQFMWIQYIVYFVNSSPTDFSWSVIKQSLSFSENFAQDKQLNISPCYDPIREKSSGEYVLKRMASREELT